MPIEGGSSQNPDKTMNYSMTGVKEIGDLSVSAGAFVQNYRAQTDKFYPNAPQYSVVGGSLGVAHAAGHSASVTAQHIPTFGEQVTAATNINVLNTNDHRVDVNTFVTQNIPKSTMPSFQTHGGGVDYQFKDTLTAGASVSRTPLFKQTDYNVSTGLNVIKTPTSSLNVGVGANRTNTQFDSGKWEPRLFLGIKKTF